MIAGQDCVQGVSRREQPQRARSHAFECEFDILHISPDGCTCGNGCPRDGLLRPSGRRHGPATGGGSGGALDQGWIGGRRWRLLYWDWIAVGLPRRGRRKFTLVDRENAVRGTEHVIPQA